MSGGRGTRGLVGAALVVLALSGCAGEDPTSDRGHSPASHSSHDSTSAPDGHDMGAMAGMPSVSPPPDDADWNAADATYLTMMVAHHSQAIDLGELARTRAADPAVRRLAESIAVGQGREVIVMATWLVDHGQPEPTPESVDAMDDMGMPGMLTRDQLGDLADLRGTAFDRRFLQDMVQHHQGAVAMAEDVMGSGRDVRVMEMAAEVVAGQGAEIRRMRALLKELP